MRRPPPWNDFIKYPVTGGTIVLAVGVTLAYWSGKVNVSPLFETVDIRRGQLWRLLTSTLPHGNILHLLFNLLWTWSFGSLIEQTFGHVKTLLIFLVLAAIANGAEYAFLTGGIGLSGIGYGLFGLLWVLSSRDPRFEGAVDKPTVQLFVGWFFFCILLTFIGYPIANVAHGMGAVAGALLGFSIFSYSSIYTRPRRFGEPVAGWKITRARPVQLLARGLLAILFVGVLVGCTFARPWINLSKEGGYEEAQAGDEALMSGHNDKALRWYRDATHMQPRRAIYWYSMGIALERLNHHAEAVSAYKRAHNLDPQNAMYRLADGAGY